MSASSVSFPAAVFMGIIGMGWGIFMAISQDHSTMPAHAHLNLLGWVSLFLMGVFYRLHPTLDHSRLAIAQVWLWIVSSIMLTVGVAMLYSDRVQIGEPIASVSSIIALADMILFGWLVARSRNAMATS